jgi:hypothetical protein
MRRALMVFVLALIFLFAFLIGSAARAESQTIGKWAAGSDAARGYAATVNDSGHRCAS